MLLWQEVIHAQEKKKKSKKNLSIYISGQYHSQIQDWKLFCQLNFLENHSPLATTDINH